MFLRSQQWTCQLLPGRLAGMNTPAVTSGDYAALASAMDKQRSALGLRWNDVADRAQVTRETLRRIRAGSVEMRSLTKGAIETALEWESGSVDTILAGGYPTPRAPTSVELNESDDDELDRILRKKYRQLVEVLGPDHGAQAFERWFKEVGRRLSEDESEEDGH